MAERQAQGGDSLEDQLRNMILTNVTIGSNSGQVGHSQNQHHQNPRGRGRGRGRGRPYSTRRSPSHWERGDHMGQGAPSSPAPRIQDSHDPNRNVSNVVDPRAFVPRGHHPHSFRDLWNPYASANGAGNAGFQSRQPSDPVLQVGYLADLASQEIPKAEITKLEVEEKEAFRQYLEAVCHKEFADKYTGDISSIKLVMFGSLASGFATPSSDMDLAIVPQWKDPSKVQDAGIDRDIPRLLERAVLDADMGGRLLTRTRVPILKVCQSPTEDLYSALLEERQRWDDLPEGEKYPSSAAPGASSGNPADLNEKANSPQVNDSQAFPTLGEAKAAVKAPRAASDMKTINHADDGKAEVLSLPATDGIKENGDSAEAKRDRRPRAPRLWVREKKLGPLDFPKSGVGIQCDINFENPLAIHNTQLLRCYSLTDPRVRPMVLFVKAWAKRRKINSAYSGTLSSYGWVLMVLHYLVNIAKPPVCPNLQSSWRPTTTKAEGLQQLLKETTVGGYAVRFWRDEAQITHLASTGQLNRNQESVGRLLLGFFEYFASIGPLNGYGQKSPCFFWTNEVLSLRTPGGLRRKEEKGWTKATTTISNGKEVRQRYLFSIEDPFELDHNVARTVTHDGIVAMRDELRRAGRILNAVGRSQQPEGGLFDEVVEQAPPEVPNKTETAAETAATVVDGAVVGVPGTETGTETAPSSETIMTDFPALV